MEPHKLLTEINNSIKEEEKGAGSVEETELKRPSTGRKKPRQVWGVNAINFAPGKKMPTSLDINEDTATSARCETEPDTEPIRKVMPGCFGVQSGMRVKRGIKAEHGEDPILALLKEEAEAVSEETKSHPIDDTKKA